MGIIDETNEARGLQIYIGSENNLFGLTGCTTIISPFKNKEKEIIGAIGVIGPMRLNYAKIIPVVDYTANMIGKKLFALSPLKNKSIPVEIVSSHYVDPKGERVRS